MSLMITFSVVPFSVRLAVIRAARLLSQADVAEMIGVDKSLISRYERGLAPTGSHVEAIEKALNVDFDAPEMEQAFKVLSQPQLPGLAVETSVEAPVKETI